MKMDFEKPDRFFPNECFICQSKVKLKRCTGCNLIAYCGKNCQSKHWSRHRTFCKAISQILERKKVTHIYENLSNKSALSWLSERDKIIEEVARQLRRFPNLEDLSILKFPRVCFVCQEAKQEKLKNCPNCTAVSFCDLHPNSETHDRSCQILRNRFDIITKHLNPNSQNLKNKIRAIGVGTKIPKTDDEPPKSLKQFLDHYTKPECKISEIEKIFFSEFFSVPLTMFQILQMIYRGNYPPEIVLHVDIGSSEVLVTVEHYWESLLHLLPEVKCLKIIHIEGQITISKESSLCKDCKSKKRKLSVEANSMPYERYLATRNYQKPSLIAYLNVSPPGLDRVIARQAWLKTIERFSRVVCPMVFTITTEEAFILTEKDFLDSTVTFNIIYSGFNNFATLMFLDEREDGTFVRNSQFMIVIRKQNDSDTSEIVVKVNRPQSCFYPQICQVCRKPHAKITCNRCRIISYCGNKHRDQHQIHHKDICRVILMLLTEMNTANLFDNAKTSDPDLWLRRKIDIMKKVQAKLDRPMEEYEEQIFLFPKTCAVCHDSDSSLLKSCECGACLCKIHYKDTNHKELCKELSIAYKFTTTEPEANFTFYNTVEGFHKKIPSSILEFINSHYELSTRNLNYQLLATSNSITASLTLSHFIRKFDSLITTKMVIHIIGANKTDIVAENSWVIFLYLLQRLKNLKIVFIGPEVMNCPDKSIKTFGLNLIEVKELKAEYYGMKYDEYFKSEKFIKPDIIFGCNLNIHEAELFGISENNDWKETILTLEKVGVPFILTSGTQKRAEKEHKTICDFFGKLVNFDFIEENPFASLCPERDFETEGVMYANKYVIAYNGKYQISLNSAEKEEEINVIKANPQLERKLKGSQENKKKSKEPISEVKEIVTATEAEKMEINSENSSENKIKKSDSLLQRNNFLSEENENLKKQLNSTNAQIAEQKNLIVNLTKIYKDFVDKFEKSINDE